MFWRDHEKRNGVDAFGWECSGTTAEVKIFTSIHSCTLELLLVRFTGEWSPGIFFHSEDMC